MSGKIEYVVSVNDTGVSGKVNGLKTGLTGVGTAATQAATKTQSLGTGLGTVATKGGQASGVMTKLKGSFAGTATGMAGLGLGIAGVASQIVGMADAYDNLKDTELKLNTMRTKTKTTTNAVTGLELKLSKMRKDGKSSAADIALVESKLAAAKEKSKNATNNLANAEDDYQRAQRAFYLQIGPQIIGIMAQMGSSIMIMKSASAGAGVGMEGASKGAKLLSLALKAIPLVAIAGAILAIRNNTFGFRDALESVGVKIGQILPGLKPFLDWVHNMAAALGLTGGGVDFGKAFELLKTGFTSAIDTIMNTDWTKVLGDMMDKISNWFNNADWKVLWTMFQNAVISRVDWINKNFGKVWDGIVNWFKNQKWGVIWANFQNAVISSVDWINTNFKKVYAAIETWIKAQDWAGIWQAFQDAFMSSVVWVREKLGAVYTAVTIWAKTQNWEAIGTTIKDGIVAGVTTVAAGTFDPWGANVIKELSSAIIKSIKTLGGLLSGTDFKGGIQQAFTDAGKAVDWISVGNAWLYDFFLDIGKWEFKTFHKTIAASFQATFEAMAAIIEFKTAAQKMVINLGIAIGQLITPKSFSEVGLRLLNAIVGAAKATGAIVTPVVISIGTEVARLFTAKNLAEVGKRFLTAFVDAVKALPGLLNSLGEWIWTQISGGAGFIGQKIQEAIKSLSQGAEAGGPGGGMPVTKATTNIDNTLAKAAMDELYQYWIRIGGNIQGIIPQLKVDPKPATDLMDALAKVWESKSTTMGAIKPALSANTKPATDLMDALAKVWQSKATTMAATKPALTANNTSAIQIIDAVVKRWQSAVSTISSKPALLKANNSDALSKINQVVSAQSKIRNITQTITTVYKTVGSPAKANTRVGGVNTNTRSFNNRIGGLGSDEIAVNANQIIQSAPTIGGGGDVNITIVNRDEFGTEKIRKYKAAMGRDRYIFGASGSGG